MGYILMMQLNSNSKFHNKRILCVTSNYPRWQGDSTTPFVHHLAQDLITLGWDIDILAPHAPMAAMHEALDGISIERFRYLWPECLETVCYQGGALMNLKQNKFNYLKLPALVFFEWLAIIKRLKDGKYDLLHSHWILPQGFTGVLATMPLKVPHIITVHGSDAFALKGKILGHFKHFSLTNADAVTVNGSATKRQVLSIAPELTNLRLIPIGISETQSDLKRTDKLRLQFKDTQGPLLIFVGRLISLKGIDDLIHAVALISKRYEGTRLIILGEGPLRNNLEKLTKSLGVEKLVKFIGWVEPSDVSNYLSAADIFIGPSKKSSDGSTEAQGLTFLEAMQAGTAVIATNAGGIVDAVQHEKTGLLVAECSPISIAKSVIRLTEDKQLKSSLEKQAKLAAKRFSRSASASEFARLFEQTLMK